MTMRLGSCCSSRSCPNSIAVGPCSDPQCQSNAKGGEERREEETVAGGSRLQGQKYHVGEMGKKSGETRMCRDQKLRGGRADMRGCKLGWGPQHLPQLLPPACPTVYTTYCLLVLK